MKDEFVNFIWESLNCKSMMGQVFILYFISRIIKRICLCYLVLLYCLLFIIYFYYLVFLMDMDVGFYD